MKKKSERAEAEIDVDKIVAELARMVAKSQKRYRSVRVKPINMRELVEGRPVVQRDYRAERENEVREYND